MSNPAEIAKMVSEVTAVVTHPNFLKMMNGLQSLPEADREKEAENIAQIATLQKHGIPLPKGFRVSTRRFENPADSQMKAPAPGAVASDPSQGLTVCGSVGMGVCVSVGGEMPQPKPKPTVE